MTSQNNIARGEIYPVSSRAFLYLLVVFLFWTFFTHWSMPNLDEYPDLLQNYVWGIRWQWGYTNHPPLFSWTVAAWFELFPRTDLNYRIFSSLNIVISLGVMILIARRFLTPLQQELTIVLSLVLPLLGFQAMRYNANAAMLPYWALIVLFYLRLWEKPRILDAGIIGLFAACAMLSKYFSATLLLTLFVHALLTPKLRHSLLGRYGIVATVVFLIVLSPHIKWLFDNDFRPFVFAAKEQGGDSASSILLSQFGFFFSHWVYVLPGFLLLGLFRSPKEGLSVFNFSHFLPYFKLDRFRFLIVCFIAPVIVAMVLSLAVWSKLTSNWMLPAHIIAPILLVALLPIHLLEKRGHWVPVIVIIFCGICLTLAPTIYKNLLAKPKIYSALPAQSISAEADRIWQQEVGRPLLATGGDHMGSYGLSFYGPGNIQVVGAGKLSKQPWVSSNQFDQESVLVLCTKPTCQKPWRATGWQLRRLSDVVVPAFEGAGGPANYKYYVWAAGRGASE